jgi:hypothetical protein
LQSVRAVKPIDMLIVVGPWCENLPRPVDLRDVFRGDFVPKGWLTALPVIVNPKAVIYIDGIVL